MLGDSDDGVFVEVEGAEVVVVCKGVLLEASETIFRSLERGEEGHGGEGPGVEKFQVIGGDGESPQLWLVVVVCCKSVVGPMLDLVVVKQQTLQTDRKKNRK